MNFKELPILKAGIFLESTNLYTVGKEIPRISFSSFGERNFLSIKFSGKDQVFIKLSRCNTMQSCALRQYASYH